MRHRTNAYVLMATERVLQGLVYCQAARCTAHRTCDQCVYTIIHYYTLYIIHNDTGELQNPLLCLGYNWGKRS